MSRAEEMLVEALAILAMLILFSPFVLLLIWIISLLIW